MEIIEVELNKLKDYENNPRLNDNAVDMVAESIKQFGFKNPIIIDKDNVIVCGHTRKRAAQKLGLKKVPCIIADDLTQDQINAFRLVDNRTNEIALWDEIKLNEELKLIEEDLSKYNFDSVLEDFNTGLEEDDEEDNGTQKKLLKCPVCGHINEEKAFKTYEDTDKDF